MAPPSEIESAPPRSEARGLFAALVITTSVALCLGYTLKMATLLEANDISRWCTVWALVEQGRYAIDDCPWQARTQDKVQWADPHRPGEIHFYSSKPPLLPTLIAGIVYPIRQIAGVPLDGIVREQLREPRRDRPDEKLTPVQWPAHVYYLKPMIVLLNVVPMAIVLVIYARILDRHAPDDWSWMASLIAAAFCTQLLVFNSTLNNHTVAAWSAFFAIAALLRIWADGSRHPAFFVAAGFFGAFAACNELPAALFGVLLFLVLVRIDPRRTLIWFIPAALVPIAAFLTTQYLALGRFLPAYAEFGGAAYNQYENSYWTDPREMDALNEPKPVYLFHMLLGHHGILSLTPIFLFSFLAMAGALSGGNKLAKDGGRLRGFAILSGILTLALIAWYAAFTHNYGGSTQGMRWLFWLYPFWLVLLPLGLGPASAGSWRRRLGLAAIALSALSIGYAARGGPWGHPWILDALEHLQLYELKR